MTPRLTERLQERLAEETATIERLTASELQRLGASLKAESDAALVSMRSAMGESVASTTALLTRDLAKLRRIGPWWWGTMAVSWATTMALLGSLLWLWMSPPSTAALLSQVGVDPVFTAEGRTYLLLPEGSQALRYQQGRGQWVPCVALPVQVQSTAPSLERTLGQSQEQAGVTRAEDGQPSGAPASASAAQGAAPSEGGQLLWPPAARPQTRPGAQPGEEG